MYVWVVSRGLKRCSSFFGLSFSCARKLEASWSLKSRSRDDKKLYMGHD